MRPKPRRRRLPISFPVLKLPDKLSVHHEKAAAVRLRPFLFRATLFGAANGLR
jgi:hypothetical protein